MAVRVAVLALMTALLAPATASAAATIGSSLPAWTGETLECVDSGGCTFVPRTIAGAPVVVPFNGVIVRSSARMPTSADTGTVELLAVHPTAIGAMALNGMFLGPPAVAGSVTQATGNNVSVRAGDLIAVELDNGDEIGIVSHATFDSSSWSFVPELSDDRAPDFVDTDDFEALFNATIEPDVDGDGYGDETQDRCPQLKQERRPCTDPPNLALAAGLSGIGRVPVGERAEIRATIGVPAHVVPDAVLTIDLPAAVRPVAIRGNSFCTTSGSRVTCRFGDLEAGAIRSVVVEVLALRPAITEVRAELTSALPAALDQTATDALSIHTTKPCGLRIRAEGGSAPNTIGGDRITGGPDADRLSGRSGDDCLSGGGGDDRLDGGKGRDVLRGGPGDDRIVGGPDRDRLEGSTGADRLYAVDGVRDLVRCGPGRDRARVDALDAVAGCERVTRKR